MKYKIKSYHYDIDDAEKRLIFTIEEPGELGVSRKYAEEIISSLDSWESRFSKDDAKKISYAAKISRMKKLDKKRE